MKLYEVWLRADPASDHCEQWRYPIKVQADFWREEGENIVFYSDLQGQIALFPHRELRYLGLSKDARQ